MRIWGRDFEGDIGGFEDDAVVGGRASQTVEVDLADESEYEVLVFDQGRARQLVAAVEFVSPANKDRPEDRRAFVSKCAALLQNGV